MATICITDYEEGSIRRYEFGGAAVRLTHKAMNDTKPYAFTPKFVEEFRTNPPDEFSVDDPPEPTNPPADSGELPCDVERAAA